MNLSSHALPHSIRAEIDIAALLFNLRQIQERAAGALVMAVVKADAYGHGVEHVIPAFREAGVEAYGVANVPEGIRLRALGVLEPILVFGNPLPEHLPAYATHGLDVAVASGEVARAVLAYPAPLRVHLKVDTGMHRLGVNPDSVKEHLARLAAAPHIEVAGVWTHLATADEEDLVFAREQIGRLDEAIRDVDTTAAIHIANSGAIARLPEAVRSRALVRPGGLLYGLPTTRVVDRALRTRPVLRLVSRVTHVQEIASGESTSYNRTWTARQDTRLATVAAGYADGVPRELSNSGEAAIGGRLYPIAGRICMDMLMLDLGPPGGSGRGVCPGDEVVLLGPGGPEALEVAERAATITYTLTTGISARVPRVAVRG
jgi:alanine racemase